LAGVSRITAGFEPDNVASLRAAKAAGFSIANEPDSEGMLLVEKTLGR
jgi:RimJ/RimL family protein N-acetyltransferase